jgi:hypothetical protein
MALSNQSIDIIHIPDWLIKGGLHFNLLAFISPWHTAPILQ